jgi:hypothetical protein
MATGYFLCTDEEQVFHTFFLENQVLATGQPVTNSYNSEEEMAVAIGTYTGDPTFYYTQIVLPPSTPDSSIVQEENGQVLTTTNLTYILSFPQTWTVNGEDVDYLEGQEIQIQEGPFLITGIVSIIEPYAYNETQTYFNLVSTNSFLPFVNYNLNDFTGTITSFSGNSSPYKFFTGETSTVPGSPSTQGFQMYGADLSRYTGYRVYWFVGQSGVGEGVLNVISYENNNISLCEILVGGSEVPYINTGDPVSFILTNDAELALPPTVTRVQGNGRTSYMSVAAPNQVFDLFEDTQTLPGWADGPVTIHIVKNGVEIVGNTADVSFWGEDNNPFSSIVLEQEGSYVPFTDQGTPITWYFDVNV